MNTSEKIEAISRGLKADCLAYMEITDQFNYAFAYGFTTRQAATLLAQLTSPKKLERDSAKARVRELVKLGS